MSGEKNFVGHLLAMLGEEKDGSGKDEFARVEKMVDEIPGGFFIYRADGNEEILCANRAMLRIFNCDTMEEFRELTGNSFRGIVHPDDLEEVERSIWEQIAHSQHDLDYVEYRIIQKGGKIRWIEDYGHFVHSERVGDIFCVFVGDATDKHQRHLAEREEQSRKEQVLQSQLQEYHEELASVSKEHLRRLEVIEGLSVDYESIFYVDLEMNLIKTYRASSRIGYQFDNETGSRPFAGFAAEYIADWVCEEDREMLGTALESDHIRRVLAERRMFSVIYRIRKREDQYLQLQVVKLGDGGDVSQVLMGVRSVDEEIRQNLQQQEVLELALHRASMAATVKTTFLANMSHDMRTPMNAVIGLTVLAKAHMDDREKLKQYLDMIEASGNQMLQLVNDILELSRVEAEQQREETCDLLQLLERVRAGGSTRAAAKGVELELNAAGLRNRLVLSDGEQIERMLAQLVGNGVNYTEKGGTVSLSVKQEPGAPVGYGRYCFTVSDTGIGIGKDFLEHIFEPFEREKNTTQSGVLGTGLGLTIVKSIVSLLGGTIRVESEQGKGSRFYVDLTLRLAKEDGETDRPREDGDSGREKKGRRILIVEDNALNMEIATELLRDAGFSTDSAEHGGIALDKIKRSKPGYYDLILMDIQMPVMNGYQTARAIRALPDPDMAAIPIIAVSANAFEEDRRKALESGMNAHVPKPIDIDVLKELIRKTLLGQETAK